MQVVAVKPAKGIDLQPVIVVMVTIAMIAKILKMVVRHVLVLIIPGADQLLCMRSLYTLCTLTDKRKTKQACSACTQSDSCCNEDKGSAGSIDRTQ